MEKKVPYTQAELRAFDLLTLKLSSSNQMHRIEGRMRIKDFIAEHGKEKCDAMFEALKKRDAKNK